MKHKLRKAVALAIVTASAFAGTSADAAAPAGSNLGTDHVRSTGSDTTYDMMVRLNTVYNNSIGCTLKLTAPELGSNCATPLVGTDTENYDHDTFVEEYPIGSGNGRTKLRLAPNDGPLVASRSSDPLPTSTASAVKDNGLSGSSYAKDGLAVVLFTGTKNGVAGTGVADPNAVTLTQAQIKTIFTGDGVAANCPTNWSQLGNPGGLTGAITPYGIQTGSGTYKSFAGLIGGDPNTCAQALPAPTCSGAGVCTATRVLFENNMAPIDGGTGTDGVAYATANDRGTAIFWMSNGVRTTDLTSTGSAKFISVFDAGNVSRAPSNTNILSGAYPYARDLWHVNRKIDVSYHAPVSVSPAPDPASGTLASVAPVGVAGNAGYVSTAGAAYSYREWLCRNGGHASAPKAYNTEITNAIQAAGFVRRTNTEVNPTTGVTERCLHENFFANNAPDTKIIPSNWKS